MSKEKRFVIQVDPLEIEDDAIFDNKELRLYECQSDMMSDICSLLNKQDQRIIELEEQLANAIVPKFKVGQEIWETTPLISWKVKRIECHKFNGGNGNIIMEIYRLGHDVTDDYNCCIMPVDNDRFFATKEEAEAKLKELKGKVEYDTNKQ